MGITSVNEDKAERVSMESGLDGRNNVFEERVAEEVSELSQWSPA